MTTLSLQSIDRVWLENYIKSLRMNGSIDVANQNIPIKFDMKNSIFADYWYACRPCGGWECVLTGGLPWCIPGHVARYDMVDITSEVTGKLVPEIVDGNFYFNIIDLEQSNLIVSGPVQNLVDLIAFPFVFGPTPGITLATIYGLNHWTDVFDGVIADGLSARDGQAIPVNELNQVKDSVNSWFVRLFQSDGDIIQISSTNLDADGLWLYFTYDASVLEDVFNRLLVTANQLGIIDNVNKFLQVQNSVYMNGFDLNKIDGTKDRLIISLSGAGVYQEGVLARQESPLKTYNERPTSPISTYGDGIYPIPANYVDSKTVAVIGTPWINSTSGSIEQQAAFWGPDPAEFAAKIKEALHKMAPNSKLILLGKSMGGCKMQEISEALRDIDVPVELLILVDGSCSYGDQSADIKDIYTNVKRVYNFRQTMPPPENDNQNGFQIEWSIPTVGQDIIVSGENIANPMCENAGHNSIDECQELLAEIDRIIRGVINDQNAPGLAKAAISIRNEGQNENNIVKPRMYVENTGSIPVSDIKVYSYFTVEDGKIPIVEDYYTPFSVPSLEKVGTNNYRLVYDFTGTTMQPGTVYPNNDGNVVGIHYSDWSLVDKNLFFSYSTAEGFTQTEKMDIKLNDGSYIFGNVLPSGQYTPDSIPQGDISISGVTTVVVPPNGVTVRVHKSEFLHGLMFTVRNAGTSDYTEVKWHGVLDQNRTDCQLRTAQLSGNGAQINNICTPKDSNGDMSFELKSQNGNTYSVIVEIYEWLNGTGCSQ